MNQGHGGVYMMMMMTMNAQEYVDMIYDRWTHPPTQLIPPPPPPNRPSFSPHTLLSKLQSSRLSSPHLGILFMPSSDPPRVQLPSPASDGLPSAGQLASSSVAPSSSHEPDKNSLQISLPKLHTSLSISSSRPTSPQASHLELGDEPLLSTPAKPDMPPAELNVATNTSRIVSDTSGRSTPTIRSVRSKESESGESH